MSTVRFPPSSSPPSFALSTASSSSRRDLLTPQPGSTIAKLFAAAAASAQTPSSQPPMAQPPFAPALSEQASPPAGGRAAHERGQKTLDSFFAVLPPSRPAGPSAAAEKGQAACCAVARADELVDGNAMDMDHDDGVVC